MLTSRKPSRPIRVETSDSRGVHRACGECGGDGLVLLGVVAVSGKSGGDFALPPAGPAPAPPRRVPLAVFGLRGSWRAARCYCAPQGSPATGSHWRPRTGAAGKTLRRPGSSGAAGGRRARLPPPGCPAAAGSGSPCSEPHHCTPGKAAEL